MAIGGITLGVRLVFIGAYRIVQATVPQEAALALTAGIAWNTLPVMAEDIPQLAAKLIICDTPYTNYDY